MLLQIGLPSANLAFLSLRLIAITLFPVHFSFALYLHLFFISICNKFNLGLLL